MNSDARRIQSQFDTRAGPDLYQYYVDGRLRDRIANPTVIVTVVVLAVTIVYQAAYQQGQVPSLVQILWDVGVSLTPARLLFAIDRLINPPLFPNPMLKTQSPTHAAKSDVLRRILGLDGPGGIVGSFSHVGRKGLSGLSGATPGSKAVADRPPGLGNYDNSCYQNSILQGLTSLKPLPAYLSALSPEKSAGLPPNRTADALRDLVANLKSSTNNGRTLWTPKVLKNMSTWQQQDAQEYYSKLLDQIDNEIGKTVLALQKGAGFESELPRDDASDSQNSQHSEQSDDSGYQSLPSHRKAGSELGLARNPLEGLMAQRVACVSCGYCEGLTMIPFNCLTLSLGNSSDHDVYERLDHYTKLEAIGGVECLKCTLLKVRVGFETLLQRAGDLPELRERLRLVTEVIEEESFDDETLVKCKVPARSRVSSTKTKQVAIARPPQSLVFHMNRSVFNETTGDMFKNSAAVRFPMTLDLGPWCLGSADGRAATGEDLLARQGEEQWPLDPTLSMVAGDSQPSKITGPIYELRAVVTHQGHHDNGHYVCYRRHTIPPAKTADGQNDIIKDLARLALETETETDSTPDPDADGESLGAEQQQHGTPTPTPTPTPLPPAQDGEAARSQWWRFSDERVYRVDESTALNQSGVFMLFYDCVDHGSVLVSGRDDAQSLDGDCQRDEDSPTLCAEAGAGGDRDSLAEEAWAPLPEYGNAR
ncbi:cysteine proteinase [Trichocladium antarcticum]|uniref:ubiquitinyl hydrolase 1 n=1 Tax=Trichocladium antarcticum TaxID=1450529 RepID=A0AAN6URX1_9PEZI|nr:cysteine proteinase [Trichocladium antarcticum]